MLSRRKFIGFTCLISATGRVSGLTLMQNQHFSVGSVIGKYLLESGLLSREDIDLWLQNLEREAKLDISEYLSQKILADRRNEATLWVNDWLISKTEANLHGFSYLLSTK